MADRRTNIVAPAAGIDPEIGRWLWAFEDTRRRTLEVFEKLTPAMIDWQPPDGSDTIGSILYHLAAIEMDWLFEEVLVQPFTEEVDRLFPDSIRDAEGRLTHVSGAGLSEHLERLRIIRQMVFDAYRAMDLAEFRRARELPDYDVTPEWVLHHLMQHEAEHRGQIDSIRQQVEKRP